MATRFHDHGLPTTHYDVWMPNLGPSEALLKAFQASAITWAEFGRRYRRELFEDGSIDQRNQAIKNHGQKFTLRLLQQLAQRGPVTLLCHCAEDQLHCHRHVLKRVPCAVKNCKNGKWPSEGPGPLSKGHAQIELQLSRFETLGRWFVDIA